MYTVFHENFWSGPETWDLQFTAYTVSLYSVAVVQRLETVHYTAYMIICILLLRSRDMILYTIKSIQFSLYSVGLLQRRETLHYTVYTFYPVYCCSSPATWDIIFLCIVLLGSWDLRLFTMQCIQFSPYSFAPVQKRETLHHAMYTISPDSVALVQRFETVHFSGYTVFPE